MFVRNSSKILSHSFRVSVRFSKCDSSSRDRNPFMFSRSRDATFFYPLTSLHRCVFSSNLSPLVIFVGFILHKAQYPVLFETAMFLGFLSQRFTQLLIVPTSSTFCTARLDAPCARRSSTTFLFSSSDQVLPAV